MKRCEKCGYKMRPGIKVCTECGAKQHVTEKLNKKPEKKTAQKMQKPLPKKKRKPIPTPDKARFIKVMKISTIALLILLVASGIGYYILNERYAPDNILGEVAEAVETGDSDALAGVVSNDMTKEEADAYLKYIDSSMEKKKYLTELSALEEGNEKLTGEQFTLMELDTNGRAFFIFPEYEVEIPKYEVTIDSEIEEGEITYLHGDQNLKWNTSESAFGNLVPGVYNFEGSLNNEGNEFESDIAIDFNDVDGGEVKGQLLLNAYYTDIQMGIYESEYGIPLEDISVYINDQKINIDFDEEGNAVYGPLNYNQSYQFTAEVNYEGKDFQAEAVEVNHSENNEVAGSNYVVPLKFDQSSIRGHLDTLEAEEKAAEEEKEQERQEKLEEEEKEEEALAAEKEAEEEREKEQAEKEIVEQENDEETSYLYYNDVASDLDEEMLGEAEELYGHDIPLEFYVDYFDDWDMLLNEIWGVIRDNMPDYEFEELKSEQLEWIEMKEETFNEGSHDVASEREKSMGQLTVQTRDRVYYLISEIYGEEF